MTVSASKHVFSQHGLYSLMGSAVQAGFVQDDGFYRVWMSDISLSVLDSGVSETTNEELDVGEKMHLCDISWGSTWKLLGTWGKELKRN